MRPAHTHGSAHQVDLAARPSQPARRQLIHQPPVAAPVLTSPQWRHLSQGTVRTVHVVVVMVDVLGQHQPQLLASEDKHPVQHLASNGAPLGSETRPGALSSDDAAQGTSADNPGRVAGAAAALEAPLQAWLETLCREVADSIVGPTMGKTSGHLPSDPGAANHSQTRSSIPSQTGCLTDCLRKSVGVDHARRVQKPRRHAASWWYS